MSRPDEIAAPTPAAAAPVGVAASRRLRSFPETLAIWLVLVALLVVAGALSEAFLRPVYLGNIIRQAAPIGIAAVGVTFVMILGGVDLSIGATISLGAVLCAAAMNGDPANIAPAVALACLAAGAIGALNGILIAVTGVSPFILTLGTAITLYGVTQLVTGGTAHGIIAPGFREVFNVRIGGILPTLGLAFLVVAAAGATVQHVTTFGRRLYLIGSNPAAARLAGLPVRRTVILAYTLSGLLGGLGGIALLARSGVSGSLAASGYEFDVLAAVVLGGTTFEGGRGGIGGTVAGVLILFVAFNLVNVIGLNYHAQLVVKGAVIIVASAIYRRLRDAGSS
jgi:ribose/xylose/arabinose/galactoside ABC-type transport system permease subunit